MWEIWIRAYFLAKYSGNLTSDKLGVLIIINWVALSLRPLLSLTVHSRCNTGSCVGMKFKIAKIDRACYCICILDTKLDKVTSLQ